MDKETIHRLYYAAIKADAEWHLVLTEQFGKRAGNIRYTKQGEGEEGTPLRAAYEAFRETTKAWREAVNLNV